MTMKTKRNLFIAFFAIIFLCGAAALFARAGGAGGGDSGGSSNGGGGEGLGYLIYIIIRLLIDLPFPFNIASVTLVVGGFYYFSRKTRNVVRQQTIYNQLPTGESVKKANGYDRFIANNPDFNEDNFKNNVRDAFMKIQQAWQDQDISPVRKFISDGVYQRFNTQFKMMRMLKQTNRLSDIDIKNIYIDRVETDGLYDIVHTAIHAGITDHFVSEIDHSLDSGGREEFVEYWSFIKKRGKPRVDIYSTDNCPNCGAPLPKDMGEMSRCDACGTQTNSGEYDWVLSEITQADDYVSRHPKLAKSGDLNEKVRELISENEDFSIQLVEDKASNGYLQILTAVAENDPSIMRRFVNDDVFELVRRRMTDGKIAFNRIFLNDVYLVGVHESDGKNHLSIAIKSSYQRVAIKEGKAAKLDLAMVSNIEVVIMSRDRGASASKGSIYAHSCASCGAPVENSLELKCGYCSTALNSTSNEWIITGLMDVSEFEEFRKNNSAAFGHSVSTSLIDKLYDARDFALNNVMVMIAVDGAIDEKERLFAETIAKKWGYNTEMIEPFFTMAENGNLVIRMPENPKQRGKILKLMEKAALADENISAQEAALLESIRAQYNITA